MTIPGNTVEVQEALTKEEFIKSRDISTPNFNEPRPNQISNNKIHPFHPDTIKQAIEGQPKQKGKLSFNKAQIKVKKHHVELGGEFLKRIQSQQTFKNSKDTLNTDKQSSKNTDNSIGDAIRYTSEDILESKKMHQQNRLTGNNQKKKIVLMH